MDTNVQDQTENTAAQVESASAPETNQVVDLDGLSEFTFQGEKYNPERFHQIFTEHKSYSEKVKSFEEEQKFVENLAIDLDNVLERPDLAQKFKATYPKKYHAVLDRYLQTNGQSSAQTQTAPGLPKEFLNEFGQVKERLNFFEQRAFQAEVDAANARLDATLPPLFKKYPMAIEDQVYSRAESLLQSGQKLTDKAWERIVRESHDGASKKADQFYGAKLKTQVEKGQMAKGAGPGGGAPGQAPVKPRTFAEAQEAMLASLKHQRSS